MKNEIIYFKSGHEFRPSLGDYDLWCPTRGLLPGFVPFMAALFARPDSVCWGCAQKMGERGSPDFSVALEGARTRLHSSINARCDGELARLAVERAVEHSLRVSASLLKIRQALDEARRATNDFVRSFERRL